MFKRHCYNNLGLNLLLNKAKNVYSWGDTVECKYLYRNKSSYYFEDIINNKDFMMVPYAKDGGGDAYNPVNRQLFGLFFMASVEHRSKDGKPQYDSYFGDTRFQASIDLLIDRTEMNLYFSDFFCLGKHCTYHYVTLVVATKNSVADKFCKDINLPLLSWTSGSNNPFFYFDGFMGYKVHDSKFRSVEICYTDTINLADMMLMGAKLIHPIPTKGKGSSKINGKPKNKLCSTCNLNTKELSDYIIPIEVGTFFNVPPKPSRFQKSDIIFKFERIGSTSEYIFNEIPGLGEHYIVKKRATEVIRNLNNNDHSSSNCISNKVNSSSNNNNHHNHNDGDNSGDSEFGKFFFSPCEVIETNQNSSRNTTTHCINEPNDNANNAEVSNPSGRKRGMDETSHSNSAVSSKRPKYLQLFHCVNSGGDNDDVNCDDDNDDASGDGEGVGDNL